MRENLDIGDVSRAVRTSPQILMLKARLFVAG